MKRGMSWRMRTLPFWALRIAALHRDRDLWDVTVGRRVSTLVSTTVPARRDITIACACAEASVAASRT